MSNPLASIGSVLNSLGIRRIHEVITGEDYSGCSPSECHVRDTFTGGTFVVTAGLCVLLKLV